MGVKILKLKIFSGSTNKHALFRALVIVSALSFVPLMELLSKSETEHATTENPKLFLDNKLVEYTNRPYIEFIEPLHERKPVDFPKSVAYLPKFIDLSTKKKKLVYIDIGAGEHMDVDLTLNWFFPLYPIERKAFDVYFVDHNTSVMLSYVKKPGVTFVYHPGLLDDGENTRIPLEEELELFPEDEDGFDFLAWFEETAKNGKFVVLKMNTSQVEMKFLSVLMETGAICYVDELFLRCSNHEPDYCIDMIRTLRAKGVFVHQWWGD